MHEPLTMAVPC